MRRHISCSATVNSVAVVLLLLQVVVVLLLDGVMAGSILSLAIGSESVKLKHEWFCCICTTLQQHCIRN